MMVSIFSYGYLPSLYLLWSVCSNFDQYFSVKLFIKTKILKQSKGFLLFYFALLLEISLAKLFSPMLWIAFTFSSPFCEEQRFKFWWNLIDFFYHLFCLCLKKDTLCHRVFLIFFSILDGSLLALTFRTILNWFFTYGMMWVEVFIVLFYI